MRLFGVVNKGVVIPSPTRWTGPWLSATRVASLQRVANRPIVCHVLDALLAAGLTEVTVLAPADIADELAASVAAEGPAGLKVRQLVHGVDEYAEALRAAAEWVGDEPCIVHRADGLLGEPLAPLGDLLDREPVDALVLIKEDEREAKRLRLVPQRMLRASADGVSTMPSGVAGVLLLGPGALARTIRSGEAFRELDLSIMAHALALAGGRVQMRFVHKWRHFDGNAGDLLYLNRTMLDALDSEMTTSTGDGNRFEGHVEVHPTACISSSVIIGPVIVGAEALIADSYIGPHTSIAERVRIEGAELERSIVLADASVLHVGGRLVASIVGREARVFRDFSMPRALRLQVGDGDEVALC